MKSSDPALINDHLTMRILEDTNTRALGEQLKAKLHPAGVLSEKDCAVL